MNREQSRYARIKELVIQHIPSRRRIINTLGTSLGGVMLLAACAGEGQPAFPGSSQDMQNRQTDMNPNNTLGEPQSVPTLMPVDLSGQPCFGHDRNGNTEEFGKTNAAGHCPPTPSHLRLLHEPW